MKSGWVLSLAIVAGAVAVGAWIGSIRGRGVVRAVFGGSLAAAVMGFELWRQHAER